MSFLRHKQIYRPILAVCTGVRNWSTPRPPHRPDESATGYSSASCTPALLASASPVRSMVKPMAGTVNHHFHRAGEFSTGDLGNFQPELTKGTRARKADPRVAVCSGCGGNRSKAMINVDEAPGSNTTPADSSVEARRTRSGPGQSHPRQSGDSAAFAGLPPVQRPPTY